MVTRLFITIFLVSTCATLPAQQIALTFDDAPTGNGPLLTGEERTARILTSLKSLDVPVAFFVITRSIDENGQRRLEQYSAAGHFLANHTHTHEWIHQLGIQRYCKGIEKADQILRPMKGFQPWFRYPFLDEGRPATTRDSIRQKLGTLGLTNGYITVDNYDWYINGQIRKAIQKGKKINFEKLKALYIDHVWNSILFYDRIAKETLGRSPKHVLLLHENDLTAYFIADLIDHLKNNGWKIISPIEAYKDPIATQIPDVLFNNQGRVGAIAKEKGIPARDLVQVSEDEAYLDDLLEKAGVFE